MFHSPAFLIRFLSFTCLLDKLCQLFITKLFLRPVKFLLFASLKKRKEKNCRRKSSQDSSGEFLYQPSSQQQGLRSAKEALVIFTKIKQICWKEIKFICLPLWNTKIFSAAPLVSLFGAFFCRDTSVGVDGKEVSIQGMPSELCRINLRQLNLCLFSMNF